MSSRSNHVSTQRGFTLIEILVVVAIIALLISILLPSLGRAREQAKAVLCGKGLTQVYTATFIYANTNKERLPNFGWVLGDSGREYWLSQLSRELGMQTAIYRCTSDETPAKMWYKRDGHRLLIKQYESALYEDTSGPWNWMGVSYSGLCDNVDTDLSDTLGRTTTSYKFPTTSLILIEGRIAIGSTLPGLCITNSQIYNALWNAYKYKSYSLDPSWTRHMKKSNMMFLDGHIAPHTPKDLTHRILWQQEFFHEAMPYRPPEAHY